MGADVDPNWAHNSWLIGLCVSVQKELQDAMQQLEAIPHEIRSVCFINPGPMTGKLMDSPLEFTINLTGILYSSLYYIFCALLLIDNSSFEKCEGEQKSTNAVVKVSKFY
ncbi:hypothetical protein EZV62_007233 [Acer yangbiense]|uniref:Uncharacterized protein n=1 Tax=Acer yangbiense TaxID=1000413 RepID=A0A5C7I9Z9_9ROSI|nr:hypothetical protein EZV62_007233 [Acer yangbiense]